MGRHVLARRSGIALGVTYVLLGVRVQPHVLVEVRPHVLVFGLGIMAWVHLRGPGRGGP